jgi:hypothetical protein
MAEETLVKETLTEEMIAAGAELTRRLDCAAWPLAASLWIFDPELNQWRLILASSVVKEKGPLEAYRHVSNTLAESNLKLPFFSISAVSPDDPLIRGLLSAYGTGAEIEGRRIYRSAVKGHFVDDAYVYRLMSVAPAA